ncbi:hydrolase TatD [Chryseobacterium shigense]|uniref:TatD DNase family protein n=1 Tax=Chryseobacterium shigense TaxID=297244 RepID=A0A1N7J584_9FLAO|nr:TatD family hydrolase [Chryseobacterium shigense]PQA93657.1 hydrolase TatD [Chryseobacterium shigense]SIS44391.1 TatD DNase family protein [Chryseobacterium shigense]
MDFFDFHHHKKNILDGIYNIDLGMAPPDCAYSIGIHPKDIAVDSLEEQFDWLESNISENCLAIGECGLDSIVRVPQKVQEQVFLRQIHISNEIRKPLIIHCVRKFYEVISLTKKAEQPVIIHGFNKKQRIAEDLLKNNFYLSFGKAVLYHLSLQDIIRNTPLDKIFLETDNECFAIEELYSKVSELKGVSLEKLNEQILENLDTIKNG